MSTGFRHNFINYKTKQKRWADAGLRGCHFLNLGGPRSCHQVPVRAGIHSGHPYLRALLFDAAVARRPVGNVAVAAGRTDVARRRRCVAHVPRPAADERLCRWELLR